MGTAGAAQAHVPRGPPGREDGQGLLRVRRDREAQVIDSPEAIRTDTTKAAIWGTVSGIAQLGAVVFGRDLFPDRYFLLIALGYALLLPVIATLHVRHSVVRQGGAVLATSAGTATVVVGIAASANADLAVAALLVRGIWWWTVGKMWAETGVVPRWLGYPTMLLAVLSIVAAVASAPLNVPNGTLWTAERVVLGAWTLALAAGLWRTR